MPGYNDGVLAAGTVSGVGATAVASVADGVWDELQTGHATSGSFAKSLSRVHVYAPELWNRGAGTDYWAIFGIESTIAAAGSSALLSDSGWTTTSLAETAGDGADLIATGDRANPPHILTNAGNDLLQSPAIFGDYGHAQVAASMLGYQPTKLCVEFYGAMTVHSADEKTTTGWGFVEAGGAAGTANDRMAWIGTDGANFFCSSAADEDAGAADDANWHVFKIELSNVVAAGTDMATWYIDGASQGTLDVQTDEWPVSFGMFASTTNRPALAWIHIWYE